MKSERLKVSFVSTIEGHVTNDATVRWVILKSTAQTQISLCDRPYFKVVLKLPHFPNDASH